MPDADVSTATAGTGVLSVEPVSVHFTTSVVLTGEGNDSTAQEG